MKKWISILIPTLLLFSISISQQKYSQVRIPVQNKIEIRRLAELGLAVDHVGRPAGRWIDVFLSNTEVKILQEHGIQFTTLIDDWNSYYARQQQLEKRSASELVASSPVKNFHLGSMGGYLTLNEVMAELDSMRAKYPALITKRDSIGTTIEKRTIWAVKISKNPDVDENEPRPLYTALHHAREPESMMQMIYFMWYLLENYGTDEEVTGLVEHREMYFVPVVNPDGYAYNQQTFSSGGGMWRKNRRKNPDSTTVGVDLNRNYGYQWGFNNAGSSSNGASETYRGVSGFSEPEAQAMRNFCIAKKFSVALNYHTYSNLLIYPWGYSDSDTRDSVFFRSMASDLTASTRYTYGTGSQTVGYVTNGNSDDWMYGDTIAKPKVFSMTPEIGAFTDGFWPAPARILPLAQENLRANLYLAHAAGQFTAINSAESKPTRIGDTVRINLTFQNKGVTSSTALSSIELKSTSPTLEIIDVHRDSLSTANTQPVIFRVITKSANPGTLMSIQADIRYAEGITHDSISFRAGVPDTLLSDGAETRDPRWIYSGSWDTTSVQSHSGKRSYSESPKGDYGNNVSSSMRMKDSLNLAGANAAELRFWSKWNIEAEYDFGIVQVSTDNGVTWTALKGKYASQGSGDVKQPLYSPGYDGVKHTWVEEVIDLSGYIGKQNLKLQFDFESDAYAHYDGWYIDDIRILSYRGITEYVQSEMQPLSFKLEQNFPNPFNPSTHFRFTVPEAHQLNESSRRPSAETGKLHLVSLKVYDVLGREVATLVNENRSAGNYAVDWNASGFASGVYFYRLTAGGFSSTKKMILMK
jgi:hypothetical protein